MMFAAAKKNPITAKTAKGIQKLMENGSNVSLKSQIATIEKIANTPIINTIIEGKTSDNLDH